MSRLFEAISIAQAKRDNRKVTHPSVAPYDVVLTTATAVGVTQTEPAQEAEAKHYSTLVDRQTAAVPEMILPRETSADMVPPVTIQEVEELHGSPELGSASVLVPGTISPGVLRSVVPPLVPVEEVETEIISSRPLHLNFVLPGSTPPDAAAVNEAQPESAQIAKQVAVVAAEHINTFGTCSVAVKVSLDSRLVALADPNSLGAEKFRALVTRLDHLSKQREMKSFQVTSSVINEGKTLVAGNVAVTLAKYSGSKTLLIEGDLHRPGLTALLGLSDLSGLSHWWSGRAPELAPFVYKLNEMPLWFLSAGEPFDRPSDILRSTRFVKAFAQLATQFEWIVVDSTPMLPVVDANLWSKLVDGTLLVVREGLAPVKAIKKGLQALDHPKLIGVVINEASGIDQVNYHGQYYGAVKS